MQIKTPSSPNALSVCLTRKSLYRQGYSEAISENQSVARSDSVMYGAGRRPRVSHYPNSFYSEDVPFNLAEDG